MPPITISDFTAQNEVFLEDVCRATGKMFADVAKEYHEVYLESIRDRDYD
jgi:hypothetical protein